MILTTFVLSNMISTNCMTGLSPTLSINPSKSCVLVTDRRRSDPQYIINGPPIPLSPWLATWKLSVPTLNLWITQWMLAQPGCICCGCFGALSLLDGRFRSRLYATYIRPTMEYGMPAFCPCTKRERSLLESVQRLGPRMVDHLIPFDAKPLNCSRSTIGTLLLIWFLCSEWLFEETSFP